MDGRIIILLGERCSDFTTHGMLWDWGKAVFLVFVRHL